MRKPNLLANPQNLEKSNGTENLRKVLTILEKEFHVPHMMVNNI